MEADDPRAPVEQQYLIIVMLLTIVQDLKRLEGEYFRRVAHDQAGHLRPDVDAIHFAAVIAANVHPRYAEAMLGYISKQEPGEKWIAENIHPLIVNLRMQEEYSIKFSFLRCSRKGSESHTKGISTSY